MKRAIIAMVICAALLLTFSNVIASGTLERALITPQNSDIAPLAGPVFYPPMDDQWDLLFSTNAGDTCGDNQLLGVEYAGGYFWATGGNSAGEPNQVYKLDDDGGLVDQFNQWGSAGWGWRDLVFDGTYLYGSDSNMMYCFDLNGNRVQANEFSGPSNPNRALAYDPATDHFWTKSFSLPIYEFDRNGTVIYTGTVSEANAAYGMAWDNVDPAGPWLWIFNQTGISYLTTIIQYDPVTHSATGTTYEVPLIPGSIGQIAGGLAMTDEFITGYHVMVGMTQGDPDDMIFVLEMYEAGPPGDLEGEVSESASGDPIQDAMVVLEDDTTYTNALGEYEFLGIAAGTYDVTASAFGYNPQTESVEIIGGQTTELDFALTQPIISVDVSEINLNLSPGEMHDETFNISNIGDGELEFDIEIDFDPIGPGIETILVVDDDGSLNNGGTYTALEDVFFDALDDAGYTYDTFIVDWTITVPPQDGPTAAEMADYDLVIWFTGETWGFYGFDVLTGNDETNLATYLDGGGNFFLSAQDYFWASYPGASSFSAGQFPYDYLGVSSTFQDYWENDVTWIGGTGSFAEGMTFNTLNPHAGSLLYADELITMAGIALLTNTGRASATQYDAGGFKIVFTTICFAGLLDGTAPSTKAQFMENLISWMGGRDADIVEAPPRPPITPTESVNPAARLAGVEHQTSATLAGPVTRPAPGYFETDQVWLECNPATGTIQPSESETITAAFDIPDTAIVGDTWEAQIIIHNNSLLGDQTIDVTVVIVTYVRDIGSELPLDYALHQNYPNPFNPSTEIRFDLRENTHVTLAVYNILGQNVLTLVDEPLDAGSHLVSFNGGAFASGVYFYSIKAGQYTDMKKMVMMK